MLSLITYHMPRVANWYSIWGPDSVHAWEIGWGRRGGRWMAYEYLEQSTGEIKYYSVSLLGLAKA